MHHDIKFVEIAMHQTNPEPPHIVSVGQSVSTDTAEKQSKMSQSVSTDTAEKQSKMSQSVSTDTAEKQSKTYQGAEVHQL